MRPVTFVALVAMASRAHAQREGGKCMRCGIGCGDGAAFNAILPPVAAKVPESMP